MSAASDAASTPLVLSGGGPFAVAFVVLHAQAGDDFFSDMAFCETAGDLRAAGMDAFVVHVHLDRDDAQASSERIDALLDVLCAPRPGGTRVGLVIFEQLWLGPLVDRVQREVGARVVETDAFAWLPGVRFDFHLARFPEVREPLVALALALREGTDLHAIPNLLVRVDTQLVPTRAPPQRFVPRLDAPFRPALDALHIPGPPIEADGRAAPERKVLNPNAGCPYADDARANPIFAATDLSAPAIAARGCSFCPMGGDYRGLSNADTVTVLVAQIRHLQAALPALDEICLRDQHALRYAAELVERCVSEGIGPVGLLFPARGDALLRYEPTLRRALEAAHGTGFWLTPYLTGYESFSQAQLDLYNKGVRVAQYADAMALARQLERAHPDAFRPRTYAASSFILFNPWTTLGDLETNVRVAGELGAQDAAQGMTLSRLRLYPNLPLYWKAKADGLLVEDPPPVDRGAAFAGYSAEATWRYADPRVGLVEEVNRALFRNVRPSETLALLGSVLRWLRSLSPATLRDALEDPPGTAGRLATSLATLRSALNGGSGRADRRPGEGARSDGAGASVASERTVLVGARCNNRCRVCLGHHREHETDPDVIARQVRDAVRRAGEVTLAGREPLLLPGLEALLRVARDAGARRVEIVTNGRLLAEPGLPRRLVDAGLTDALVKLHADDPSLEDAFTRARGSAEQLLMGLERARRGAPELRLTALVVLTALNVDRVGRVLTLVHARGLRSARLMLPVGGLELGRIEAFVRAIEAARRTAERLGVSMQTEGF